MRNRAELARVRSWGVLGVARIENTSGNDPGERKGRIRPERQLAESSAKQQDRVLEGYPLRRRGSGPRSSREGKAFPEEGPVCQADKEVRISGLPPKKIEVPGIGKHGGPGVTLVMINLLEQGVDEAELVVNVRDLFRIMDHQIIALVNQCQN